MSLKYRIFFNVGASYIKAAIREGKGSPLKHLVHSLSRTHTALTQLALAIITSSV